MLNDFCSFRKFVLSGMINFLITWGKATCAIMWLKKCIAISSFISYSNEYCKELKHAFSVFFTDTSRTCHAAHISIKFLFYIFFIDIFHTILVILKIIKPDIWINPTYSMKYLKIYQSISLLQSFNPYGTIMFDQTLNWPDILHFIRI